MKKQNIIWIRTIAIMGMFIMFISGCKKDPVTTTTTTGQNIVISTNPVTNISSTSVTCGGFISSDGGNTIIQRGVCWSKNNINPTVNDSLTDDGTMAGNFASQITNLSSNTTYYVRAYAINSKGTAYGSSVSFTTTNVSMNPTISFQSGMTSLVFNGTNSINLNVTLSAPSLIQSVSLQGPSLTGTGTTTLSITNKMGTSGTDNAYNQTSAVYLFNVSTSDLALAAVNHNTGFTYTFTVNDQLGNSATGTFTVTISTTNTPLAYENTSGVIWNLVGPYQGAWDLGTNVGVSSSGAESTKDMKNTSTVASGWVNAWTTGTGNGTLYVKTSVFDYNNATLESATSAYAAGTAVSTVTNPATNDIYIAKLRGGTNYAVIKITNIVVTPSDNLDKIEFSYKKQTSSSN